MAENNPAGVPDTGNITTTGELAHPLGAAPCSAFEMVDATDDEQYFPLGVWLTLEAAIAALDECKDPDDLGSDGCHDDYAKVEIRQRAIGWSAHGKKVYQREWAQKYDEAKDEYEWRVMPNAPLELQAQRKKGNE